MALTPKEPYEKDWPDLATFDKEVRKAVGATRSKIADCPVCHNMRMVIEVDADGNRAAKDCECRLLWRKENGIS